MTEHGCSTVQARALLALSALALIGMGCSSNPLDGSWITASTVGTFTTTETVEVNSDGTLSVAVTATSSSCSGASNTTGYQWAATATEITVSGTPVCTGSITCGALTLACTGATGTVKNGSCTYALSSGNDTLALTACTGITATTFTRAN